MEVRYLTPEQAAKSSGVLCHGQLMIEHNTYCLAFYDQAVCAFHLSSLETAQLAAELKRRWPRAVLQRLENQSSVLMDYAHRILVGENTPLLLVGTAFQCQVWRALLKIPAGQCLSYQALAHAAKLDRAVRAVASAVAKNPVALAVPCHRVIRQSGAVGQYHWGVECKQHLLRAEGVVIRDGVVVDTTPSG